MTFIFAFNFLTLFTPEPPNLAAAAEFGPLAENQPKKLGQADDGVSALLPKKISPVKLKGDMQRFLKKLMKSSF